MTEENEVGPRRLVCRGCSSERTTEIVDLGVVPASDWFPLMGSSSGDDPRWSLRLFLCEECFLAQLGPDVYPTPEPPRAVESETSRLHAARSASEVMRSEGMTSGDSIIELDSHHGGSWLNGFIEAGMVARSPGETADLVVDVHTLAHEANLEAPLASHAARVAEGGRLVLEFHHLLPLIEQSQVDTIRHGHWVYLSLLSVQNLLNRHGFELTRAVQVPVFGGSLRVTAGRSQDHGEVDSSVNRILAAERDAGLDDSRRLRSFGSRGQVVASQLREHLEQARSRGVSVAGYGAPSKAPVIVALAGIDQTLLPYTVDLSPDKNGRRLPGTQIPIFLPEELLRLQPEEVVVFTWDIVDEVARQLHDAARGTGWDPRFYVPLPDPGYFEMSGQAERNKRII